MIFSGSTSKKYVREYIHNLDPEKTYSDYEEESHQWCSPTQISQASKAMEKNKELIHSSIQYDDKNHKVTYRYVFKSQLSFLKWKIKAGAKFDKRVFRLLGHDLTVKGYYV